MDIERLRCFYRSFFEPRGRGWGLIFNATHYPKVTIVANQKTLKNVKADDYWVGASFDVTVKDEKIEAKQVGRNTVEVTGTDLTEKVEDYVVKRGNTTVALASAKLSEDKKSVKLVASSKNLVAGDYKVTFNENTAEFKVEASKVTEIKFTTEVAVLKKGVTSQASVGYKVLNQFGEDAGVTRDELAITTSCDGDALTVKPGTLGTIVFGKTAGFVVGLDKVVATIVYTKTGVNASATLDIAAEAKPATVELLGFYKTKGTEYTTTELAEGSFNGVAHFFVVNVKDQYGNAVKAADISATNLKINFAAPLVGINLKETGLVDVTANGAFVGVGYPVSEGAISGSGEISVVAVVLTSGNTASATYKVAAAKTIVSFDNLAATDGLYVDKATEFTFTALDADGNEVTDYTTLNSQVSFSGSTGITFAFAKQADGSAKLYGTPSTKNPVAVVNTTKKITYKTFILSANDVRVPNAVTSVSKDAFLGALSGQNISVALKHINVEDQYGNPMTTAEVIKAVSGGAYSICVATDAAVAQFGVTTGVVVPSNTAISAPAGAGMTAADHVVINSTTAGKGTQSISVYLMKDGKKIDNSECTVVLRSFAIDDLSNFEVADLGLAQAGTTKNLTVYGQADGVKVKLPASAYTITKGDSPAVGVVSIKAIDTTDKETEYTTDYQVTIDNKLGSVVNFKVNSSEKAAVPTTATLNATAKIANNTTVNATAILGNLEVKDQYGNVISAATLATDTLITVSNYTATSTLTKNGTSAITYKDADTVAHFKFVFKGGYTAEFDISVY